MQRCSHSLSTASALRSIFFPTSNQTCVSTFLTPSYAVDAPLPPYQPRRQLNTSQASRRSSNNWAPAPPSRDGDRATGGSVFKRTAVAAELRRFGPQKNRRPKDEEITARTIRLVGGADGTARDSEVMPLNAALRQMDREKFFLVQVSDPDGDGVPPCRAMARKQYFEYEQKRESLSAAAARGNKKPVRTAKQLELSWGIGPNDVEHRLKKALDFLDKGKKLEVILAHKKRGKSTPPDECAALVRSIKDRITQFGHKEGKPMDGKIGGLATLFFEPKVQS